MLICEVDAEADAEAEAEDWSDDEVEGRPATAGVVDGLNPSVNCGGRGRVGPVTGADLFGKAFFRACSSFSSDTMY